MTAVVVKRPYLPWLFVGSSHCSPWKWKLTYLLSKRSYQWWKQMMRFGCVLSFYDQTRHYTRCISYIWKPSAGWFLLVARISSPEHHWTASQLTPLNLVSPIRSFICFGVAAKLHVEPVNICSRNADLQLEFYARLSAARKRAPVKLRTLKISYIAAFCKILKLFFFFQFWLSFSSPYYLKWWNHYKPHTDVTQNLRGYGLFSGHFLNLSTRSVFSYHAWNLWWYLNYAPKDTVKIFSELSIWESSEAFLFSNFLLIWKDISMNRWISVY